MAPTTQIRPAVPQDFVPMGELGASLVATHHRFDPLRFLAPTEDMAERYANFLREKSQRAEAILLVAEVEGEVVGYAFSGVEGADYMALRGPAGVIYDLVVDEGHRRRGIGSALLGATFGELQKRGVPRVVLFTAEKNEAAQHLFQEVGFRRTMIEMTAELDAVSGR